MGSYRVHWDCCDSVSVTEGYEPPECPFCAPVRPQSSCIISGSFDPLTKGHQFLVLEALKLFNCVHLIIAPNPSKGAGLLSPDERLLSCIETFADEPRVRVHVMPAGIFLVDYAKSLACSTIVRGLRNATDFEYEHSVDMVQRKLSPNVRTLYMITPREYTEVSSTLVRSLYGLQGWELVVADYVPDSVLKLLKAAKQTPEPPSQSGTA
jgi:pantetheine-phosphate adenylyltransferase/8-oxo-dGTP diphosphatase